MSDKSGVNGILAAMPAEPGEVILPEFPELPGVGPALATYISILTRTQFERQRGQSALQMMALERIAKELVGIESTLDRLITVVNTAAERIRR